MKTKSPIYLSVKKTDGEAKESSHAFLEEARRAFFRVTCFSEEEIFRTPEGKPYFPSGRIHLSVTHTGSLFCACFASFPIGIDAEKAGEKRDRVTKRYFSREEERLPFAYVWCAKEAVAKLVGGGLSLVGRILVEEGSARLENRSFTLFPQRIGEYLLMIAVEEGTDFDGTETLSEK